MPGELRSPLRMEAPVADPATWRDRYEYLRAQRDIAAKRATAARNEARECRKRRDFLGMLRANDRAAEFRASRISYADEARAARAQLRSSSQGILDNCDTSVTRHELCAPTSGDAK